MRIEEYKTEMLKSLAKLCRQTMPLDSMPDFLFEENVHKDSGFRSDMTLVAYDQTSNLPIGFIMGVIRKRPEENMGYIKLLFVDQNFRRTGVARTLYSNVEEIFKKEGIKKVRLFESYPNYYMPGVDPFYTEAIAFFERMKFKKFQDTSNLIAELGGKDFSTDKEIENLKADGIIVKRADENDKESARKWILKSFAAWESEIMAAYENDPVSMHVAMVNNEVVAFSAHEVNNRGTGWFGPMGTDESLRGKGIGGILLKRCLQDMKEMGFSLAIIPWVGPIPFYMHYANAKMQRVFWRYEKELG